MRGRISDKRREEHMSYGLGISANYQFCFTFLTQLFFRNTIDFDKFYGNEEDSRKLLYKILFIMAKNGIFIPPGYTSMPIRFAEKDGRKAIVFELPDPMDECECNFAALRKDPDGKQAVVTNEYYSVGVFRVCVNLPNVRFSTIYEARTYEEFAAKCVEVDINRSFKY